MKERNNFSVFDTGQKARGLEKGQFIRKENQRRVKRLGFQNSLSKNRFDKTYCSEGKIFEDFFI